MKKILTIIVILIIAFAAFFVYKKYYLKDSKASLIGSSNSSKVINNVQFNLTDDGVTSGFTITASWECNAKYDLQSSYTKIEIVVSKRDNGAGRRLVLTKKFDGLTLDGTKNGKISCYIPRSEITKSQPYLWAKISFYLNGKLQKPIIKNFGKFEN